MVVGTQFELRWPALARLGDWENWLKREREREREQKLCL